MINVYWTTYCIIIIVDTLILFLCQRYFTLIILLIFHIVFLQNLFHRALFFNFVSALVRIKLEILLVINFQVGRSIVKSFKVITQLRCFLIRFRLKASFTLITWGIMLFKLCRCLLFLSFIFCFY
jgi:hypothetical protein